MKANLYDFDKTVYPCDSGIAFWKYCLKRKPSLITCLPRQAVGVIKYMLNIGDTTRDKAQLFCFVKKIDATQYARDFWKENKKNVYDFFLPENREYPAVVCSASPDFFLRIICEELEVDTLIATHVDPKEGTISGRNCNKEEKVRRIKETVPDYEFVNVYSDNMIDDAPILRLGENAFHAKKSKLIPVDMKRK